MNTAPAVAAQRGVAAVEFALVLPLFILILFGIIGFGSAFYTQLVVSRAAEDGARAIGLQQGVTDIASLDVGAIKEEVRRSLANSAIAPSGYNNDYTSRLVWMDSQVADGDIDVDSASCGAAGDVDGVRVRIRFPYEKARMLPSSSLTAWMPDTLTGCAVFPL